MPGPADLNPPDWIRGEEERRKLVEDDGYMAEQTRIATDNAFVDRAAAVVAESERLKQDNDRIIAERERIRANGENTRNG